MNGIQEVRGSIPLISTSFGISEALIYKAFGIFPFLCINLPAKKSPNLSPDFLKILEYLELFEWLVTLKIKGLWLRQQNFLLSPECAYNAQSYMFAN